MEFISTLRELWVLEKKRTGFLKLTKVWTKPLRASSSCALMLIQGDTTGAIDQIDTVESGLPEGSTSFNRLGKISITNIAIGFFHRLAGVLKSTLRGARERLVFIIRMSEEPRLSDPRIPTKVWMLGVPYELGTLQVRDPGGSKQSEQPQGSDQLYLLVSSGVDAESAFKNDMRSRFWLTYRRNFEPIRSSGLTSDAGWGCMLRSGQMMMAQALLHHRLGRAWRLPDHVDVLKLPAEYFDILKLFHDHPTSLFSVHNIAIAGEEVGKKKVGQWLGPCTVCAALARLHAAGIAKLGEAAATAPYGDLQLLLFDSKDGDNTIYKDAARSLLEKGPTLILLPVRLGAHTVDPSYVPKLSDTFRLPQSIGFVGGRPSSAHYFVASRGDVVYYLDPHFTQDALLDARRAAAAASAGGGGSGGGWHCGTLRHMWLRDIDASLTLGFYCTSPADLDDLCQRIGDINAAHKGYPAVFVADKRPTQTAAWDGDDDVDADD